MEVALNDVSSLVRSWLNSPQKGPSKPLPNYQPISPRPERLGLGADLPVNKSLTRSVFDVRVQQSLNGRRKLPAKEREEVAPPLQQGESSDDDGYSRTVAVGTTKRRGVSDSFIVEMAHSRKRKRRRKGEAESTEGRVNGAVTTPRGVKENGDSTCARSQTLTDMKTTSDLLEQNLHTDFDSHCSNKATPNGSKFQLFVYINGDSSQQEKVPCSSKQEKRPYKLGHLESRHAEKQAALRGGSAHCCRGRLRKQPSHRKSSCEPRLQPTVVLSNSDSFNSSKTIAVSRVVGKQRHHSKTLNGREREKEPAGSPTHLVDPDEPDMSGDVVTNGGVWEVAMERGRQGKRITRCRRGRLNSLKSSSLQLARKLYLRKI